MVAVDRRAWMIGATASIVNQPWKYPLVDHKAQCMRFKDAVSMICRSSPLEFRRAVRDSSGRFLYRGESVDCPEILHPKPDLLLPETYNEPEALRYFESLQNQLSSTTARPDNGHIGTGSQADAAQWGSPVSVWPLGHRFSYVWPKDRSLIYPGGSCPVDTSLVIDQGLSTALAEGKEVLFASWFDDEDDRSGLPNGLAVSDQSAYIVMPADCSHDLHQALLENNYGLVSRKK